MDPVYRKTAKGQEAITTRAHGLVGRLRSLLILVDGQRPQSALAALASGFGDVPQMLAQLQGDGFIDSAQATGAVPVVAATAAQEPTPRVVSLAEAKVLASRHLMQVLGPTSDALCLRIEAARNRPEFVEAIRRAYAVVGDIRGRAQAEAFGAIVEANLPPG